MDETPRITELRKKLEKDPGSRLFAQLAEELRKEGRHDDAIAAAQSGLERHPNYPSARLTLARALLDSGRPGEARPELEQVVRGAPDNILASRLLGEALEGLGEAAQAVQQFEQTLRLSPGDKALGQKIADLKLRMSSPPSSAMPSVELGQAAAPAVSIAVPEEPLPSALPEVALPSVPEVSVPDAPGVPAPAVALDRDLASGTFSPGRLSVTDLQKHFDQAAPEAPAVLQTGDTVASEGASRFSASVEKADTVSFLGPSALADPEAPLPSVQVPASPVMDELPSVEVSASPVIDELPSVEVPSGDPDVGASTLPLSSVTLADLYLQQGLKAEASAVLSQVMKEEPENAQAKSKFAAVSDEMARSQPEPAEAVAEIPAAEPPSPPKSPSDGRAQVGTRSRSRAVIDEQSIASLKALLSAVEREAIHQRATERGAF